MVDWCADLNHHDFKNHPALTIYESHKAGFHSLLLPSSDWHSTQRNQLLVDKYPWILGNTLGVHARDTSNPITFENMRYFIRKHKPLALQCQLQFSDHFVGHSYQMTNLHKGLQLMSEYTLPMIIDMDEGALLVCQELGISWSNVVVRTDSPTVIQKLAPNAATIEVTPAITWPQNTLLREAIRTVPVDQLVMGSHCPRTRVYGQSMVKPSTPADLHHVVETLAEMHSVEPIEMEEQLLNNSRFLLRYDSRFF